MDLKEREAFKKKIHNKGGIYMIQYKHAPSPPLLDLSLDGGGGSPKIFYLGRTTNFYYRLRNHFVKSNWLSSVAQSKFYSKISKIGWEHFNIHILKILDSNINLQIKVENKLLDKYKPVLNTILSANTVAPLPLLPPHIKDRQEEGEGKVDNFTAFLRDRQRPILVKNKRKEFTTYLYKYNSDSKINSGTPSEIKFLGSYSNLIQIKNITGLDPGAVKTYINTDYPKNGYLFSSTPTPPPPYYRPAGGGGGIENLLDAFLLTKNLTLERPYKHKRIIPVWAYQINSKGKLELINNGPPPPPASYVRRRRGCK